MVESKPAANLDRKSPTNPSETPVAVATMSQANASIDTSRMGKPLSNSPAEMPVPKNFGRYKIEKELGKGAMGVVYLAEDTQLGRKVALKIPKKSVLEEPDALERFYREAKTTSQIRHANICPVFDVGAIDGVHYLTMAYIPGKPVNSFLGKGKLPPAKQVALLIRKIALALEEAHRQGVVHRDLKPTNVMLDDRGEPIVMDFGLAHNANTAENARLTQSGAILGTPAYMAPEQVRGELEQIGPQADIYALGVMMYQFLTGELPFTGPIMMVFAQIISNDAKKPSEVRPDVDLTLEAICLKMMAKKRDDRFASMKDVAAALTEFIKTGTTSKVEITESVTAMPNPIALPDPELNFDNLPEFPDVVVEQEPRRGRKKVKRKKKSAGGMPPVARLLLMSGVPGGLVAIVLYAVFFVQWGSATVRIEIDDPSLRVRFGKNELTIENDGQPITVKPGKLSLLVSRDGFNTETKTFSLKKGETKQLTVSLMDGQIQMQENAETGPAATAKNTENLANTNSSPPPAVAPFDAKQARAHQEAWAKHLGVPVEWENSIGMKFRLIPPGEFLMGTSPEEIEVALNYIGINNNWQAGIKSEGPRHKVILTQPIYLGIHEVTQLQYEKVMGTNPSFFAPMGEGKERVAGLDTMNFPVETVSRNDFADFCTKLSNLESLDPFEFQTGERTVQFNVTGYRLPSEAEWEFACRAGTTTKYWCGDKNEDLLRVGWFRTNSGSRTHAVGELSPNPFGLFDMHGNVWETVLDGWDETHYSSFEEIPAIDPIAFFNVNSRGIIRGGEYDNIEFACRSSLRHSTDQGRGLNCGFRAAVSVDAVRQVLNRPKPAIAPFNAEQAKAHQEAWAKHLGVPVEWTNRIGMKFVLIPPGEFMMGSTEDQKIEILRRGQGFAGSLGLADDTPPPHRVILTRPIYVGIHEVTQQQYDAILNRNPSYFAKGDLFSEGTTTANAVPGVDTANFPVENVNWYEAVEFCIALSQRDSLRPNYIQSDGTVTFLEGDGYRLPTDAEWEFACRAGSSTRYWSGNDLAALNRVGWWSENSGFRMHPVGQLEANPFGLFDVHGGVWEFVQDQWSGSWWFKQFQDRPAIDPKGLQANETARILRGGCWYRTSNFTWSSCRHGFDPFERLHNVGFRVSVSVDAVKQALAKKNQAAAPPPAVAPFNAKQARAHQEAWAKHLGLPVEWENSIGMKFVLIPPGEFLMGSTEKEVKDALNTVPSNNDHWKECVQREAPQHTVILTNAIYLSTNEVTQVAYEQVSATNPSHFSSTGAGKDLVAGINTANHPVEMVSWNDAAIFCEKLSQTEKIRPFYSSNGRTILLLDGIGYRMPTEAEWEFACRAGTSTKYWIGEKDEDVLRAAWILDNSGGRTHAVGELAANPFGLSDVAGNVWEWVQDGWDPPEIGPFDKKKWTNPSGPFSENSNHIVRGGQCLDRATYSRSAVRNIIEQSVREHTVGFRVAVSVDAVKQKLAKTNQSRAVPKLNHGLDR